MGGGNFSVLFLELWGTSHYNSYFLNAILEQEDPGESLSDSDKDDDESLEEGCPRADEEDESEDGFFVPDGYLSENEVSIINLLKVANFCAPNCRSWWEVREKNNFLGRLFKIERPRTIASGQCF